MEIPELLLDPLGHQLREVLGACVELEPLSRVFEVVEMVSDTYRWMIKNNPI